MTQGVEMLPVEQADRVFATTWMVGGLDDLILNGDWDDHPSVQAVARHRLNTHPAATGSVRCPVLACLASLRAAISLLEKGGKKAAPSDKMFAQMLVDYNRAADNLAAALAAAPTPDAAAGEAGEVERLREAFDGLEVTEDGYSLRTPYDGDADGDGRHIVVGGEIVVTFADSDEGDRVRMAVVDALGLVQ